MTTLAPPLKSTLPVPVWPISHRYSVDEYFRMKELGIIPFEQRTELIRGLIIDIMPGGDRQAPHRFSIAEYDRMGELGLIPEKTELISGEVIDKMGQCDLRDIGIETINRFLALYFRYRFPFDVSVHSRSLRAYLCRTLSFVRPSNNEVVATLFQAILSSSSKSPIPRSLATAQPNSSCTPRITSPNIGL